MKHNFRLQVRPATRALGPEYVRAVAITQAAKTWTRNQDLTAWAKRYSNPDTPIEDWKTAWTERMIILSKKDGDSYNE